MTIERTTQAKLSLREKISAILIALRDNYGMKGREVAKRVNVDENTVSKLLNKNQDSTEQMLSTLELLLENAKLKRALPPPPMGKLEEMQARIENLEHACVKLETDVANSVAMAKRITGAVGEVTSTEVETLAPAPGSVLHEPPT